jgi:hypothetical protein
MDEPCINEKAEAWEINPDELNNDLRAAIFLLLNDLKRLEFCKFAEIDKTII